MFPSLTHYLLVSWRNFGRYKGSFLINLLGLSTGLAASLLILLWVQSEVRMDKFHKKDSQLYQILENRVFADRFLTAESTSALLAPALKAEFPSVETAVTVAPARHFAKRTLAVGEQKIKAAGQFATVDYFQAFSYHLWGSNPKDALKTINSIVLSGQLAKALFKSPEQAIGKQVLLGDGKPQPFQVSAVFEMPANSSESFDFILPFDVLVKSWPSVMEWGNTAPNTYVVLKPGTDVARFNEQIAGLVKRKSDITHRTLFATRYSDHYLHGTYENGKQNGGRITYVRLLSAIAVFILLIACINFMNLATARASRRLKEIGVKKAIGATSSGLSVQFLTESLLMTCMAFALALLLVFLFMPSFNQLTGKQLSFSFDAGQCLMMGLMVLTVSLVAGSYPAIYLSRLRVLQTIKGKLQHRAGTLFARRGLVIFQFTLSLILIVSVLVVYRQINYVLKADTGYDRSQVVTFEQPASGNVPLETLLNRIKAIPGVLNASAMNHTLAGHNGGTRGIDWEGKDPGKSTEFEAFPVYYGLTETLGMHMKSGRDFSPAYGSDTTKIIFNEAAIDFMSLKDPIGKTVRLWDQEMQIVGVVRDFHFESFHEKVKPLFMYLDMNPQTLFVKMNAGKEQETLKQLQDLYRSYHPGVPFDYQFMDSTYAAQYAAESRVSALASCFAGLAIFISCLGLIGLAAFTAELRKKEIGVRKVLGASVTQISALMSGEFIGLVAISILIAFPISWLISRKWLDGFAYHISPNAWIFAASGIGAIFIAALTVGFQAIRAAMANPVGSLRDE